MAAEFQGLLGIIAEFQKTATPGAMAAINNAGRKVGLLDSTGKALPAEQIKANNAKKYGKK